MNKQTNSYCIFTMSHFFQLKRSQVLYAGMKDTSQSALPVQLLDLFTS